MQIKTPAERPALFLIIKHGTKTQCGALIFCGQCSAAYILLDKGKVRTCRFSSLFVVLLNVGQITLVWPWKLYDWCQCRSGSVSTVTVLCHCCEVISWALRVWAWFIVCSPSCSLPSLDLGNEWKIRLIEARLLSRAFGFSLLTGWGGQHFLHMQNSQRLIRTEVRHIQPTGGDIRVSSGLAVWMMDPSAGLQIPQGEDGGCCWGFCSLLGKMRWSETRY